MTSSSTLSSLISWKGDLKSSKWISSKALVGSSISISRKAAVGSSISICQGAAAGTDNLVGGVGTRMNTMSVSHESVSSMPSKISPWLMLPPDSEGDNMVYKFYSLAENKVLSINKRGKEESKEVPDDDSVIVGSSHGWLALFNERNCDLFLSNPITRQHIKLPPVHTLPIPQENLRGCIKKVIISCSPNEEECRAIMSFGPEEKPACCWPGRSTEWTPLSPGRKTRSFEDFVYSSSWKLFFCATNSKGNYVEAWDLRDPPSPRMIPIALSGMDMDEEEIFNGGNSRRFAELLECSHLTTLVVADNEIYYVTRLLVDQMAPDGSSVYDMHLETYPYKTIGFYVYKYIPEKRVLRLMPSSLDGLAFFLGHNHGFALSAREFPGLKPNAIYFTDVIEPFPFPVDDDLPFGGHDLGIFDYEKRTLSSCYYPCDVQSIKRIQPAPMWFTPTKDLDPSAVC